MQFEFWYDATGQRWYWHLKDIHGTTIALPPEGFVSEENCLACIQVVQRSMQAPTIPLPVKNLSPSE